jgi:hypothetical protein
MKRFVASDRVFEGGRCAAVLAAYGAIGALAVLGCRGDSGPAMEWDGAVRDSAGIEIVENFGAPLWPEGPGWEFTEDLRIGALDGPPEYQHGRIVGLQVLSDGRIVIVDAMTYNVRFYSPDGVHELTVGRKGEGPGELGDGGHMLFRGPGDTLLVGDGGAGRVHVLAPDGSYLETYSRMPKDGYTGGYWAFGRRTGRITSLHRPLRQSDGTLPDTFDILLERDVHGGIVDTLARLPSRHVLNRAHEGVFRRYYNANWWHNAWGDDHVIARTDRYRFHWHGRDRQLKRIVSMVREPQAMTEEDRELFLWRWDELFRERGVPADRWEEIKSGIRFADTYPPYAWFDMGPAGTLLVQRVWPVRELDEEGRKNFVLDQQYVAPGSSEWDVFDREGRYLGAVTIPGSEFISTVPLMRFFQDAATGTWHMYSIVSDELGVQYIVGWRIDGRMPEDIEATSLDT